MTDDATDGAGPLSRPSATLSPKGARDQRRGARAERTHFSPDTFTLSQ
ncbi:MAG: hypothetical protein IPK56_02830 [Elusimicrobia bacterium]|nr:hypothetical protein [Elusimicrobiota bacterium]